MTDQELQSLEKKIFVYDSSIADKRFFKNQAVAFLKSDQSKTFTRWMFHAIWKVNNEGKTLKYADFNEYRQKVEIDESFYKWMVEIIARAKKELEKIRTTHQ